MGRELIASQGSADAVTLAAVVLGALLTLIGALALIIFNGIRSDLRDIRAKMEKTQGHLSSVADSMWEFIWHLDEVEDFLERAGPLGDAGTFRPPKLTRLKRDDPL